MLYKASRARGVSAARALILFGTALGGAVALPAQAEKVVFNGSGDFTATRTDTLTDTAQVVDVRTTTGNLLLNFTELQAASSPNGSALFANVTTAGTIGVTTGTVTVTGTDATNGVNIAGTNGNITLTAGTTTANTNNADRAINVTTPIGNITINSTLASGSLRGISTSDGTGNALPNGITTINSGTALANGTGQINAIVGQGRTVNITSGTASLTNAGGNAGAAIFVQAGDGGATVKSTTVNAAGVNQSGIEINSFANGAINVDSGAVTMSQGGKALYTKTTGAAGATTIKSSTINLTGSATGIQVDSGTGANSIDSGSIASTTASAVGIVVNAGTGTTAIKSDNINLTGANSSGILVNGGDTTTGALTITSNKINAVGASAISYSSFGNNGTGTGGGAVTINSTAITGTATGGGAISVNNNAGISITSGSIAQNVAAGGVNSLQGSGIQVTAQGTAAATINSGSVVFTGTGNTAGIQLQAVGGGAGTITSTGPVTVTGNGGYGILGYSSSGPMIINAMGDVTTVGTTRYVTGTVNAANARYADGIQGYSLTGAVTINNSGTVSTSGASARGITAEAGRVFTDFGNSPSPTASTAAININNSGTVKTTGANSVGIYVLADENAVTLTSANVTTSGANAHGISVAGGRPASGNTAAIGGTGAINVTTGNVAVTGTGSDAVRLVSNSGPITANVTGALSATNGTGLFIDPPSAVVINVAAGASARGSVNGISTVGATNTITNLGTVSNSGTGAAILASGVTSISNSGTITAGTGGVAVQLGATNDSVTLRNGSSVTGAIAGGGGVDTATLAGTATTPTAAQTIARFTGFDSLNVASGYWTAAPANASAFNSATVASGASLELANAGAGLGITVPSIVDNGTLVVRSTSAGTGSTFGATTVSGSGNVLLAGAGTVTLDGTNSLVNTGAITVEGGTTALLTGTQGGNFVTNAGGTLQIGNGGTTGAFTGNLVDNGTLVIARSDDYTFGGALSGAGTIVKQGAGKLTFGSGYAFTGVTNILGGSVRLTTPVAATTELAVEGAGQLDLSGTRQTVAELAGSSSAASVNIAGGALTVNQSTNTGFAGNLTGNGALTKSGSGTLNLTGTNTYTGPTTVDGGRLAVNGSIASAVTVNTGARLGGTGSVGGASISTGGTYAPGNSIGTQTVNGNVAFAAGSTYEVEANADGRSDRILATGTATLTGGTVAVLAEAGNFNKVTSYNILTATGGVTGRFANVTSNFAFLSPLLDYTPTAVNLTLARNDVSFGSIATNPNQLAVANAVASRNVGDAVFNAVILQSTESGRAAFDALGGELFASVPTVLVDESRRVRGAVLDRAASGGDGVGVWASGMLGRAESSERAGVAQVNADRKGVLSGIDFGRDGLRFGAGAGFIDSDINLGARSSTADIQSKLVTAYVGWASNRLSVQAGASYTWHEVDSRRAVAVTGLAGTQAGSFDADSRQAFGEIAYSLIDGPVTFGPFAGYAHVRTHSDAVREAGNAASLAVASSTRNVDFATLGLRIGGVAPVSASASFLPKMSVSYQRAWGDRDGVTVATFGGTGAAFGVTGATIGRDTFNIDGGFDVAVGAFRIGAGAFASTAKSWSDFGGKVSAGFTF